MKIRKKIGFLLIHLLLCASLWAENVNFSASAPTAVANGSNFQISYSVNSTDAENFKSPDFGNFSVLMGPSTSVSRSYQFVNGKATSTATTTYTYVLNAAKEGTFTIPAASVTVDGKKYFSNQVTIKVLHEERAESSSSSQQTSQQSSTYKNVGGVSVFMRAVPSKVRVYEQEAFLLTYKLYAKGANVIGMPSMKFPETKGFLSQEILLPDEKQWVSESYDGTLYNTVVLKQSLLFPQKSGELTIPAGKFEAVLRVPNGGQRGSRSIFDDFFDTYSDVRKDLKTEPLKITVKKLPAAKPASFSNAVGSFKMKSAINATNVKTNDAVTVKIEISGNGNLKLIKNPEIKFPADFEVYDPKVTNNYANQANGVVGTRTIEYLAIPRYAGKFTIPSAEFSYFDLDSKTYKTLRTEAFSLNVEKNSGDENSASTAPAVSDFSNKKDVKHLGSDIRYINTKSMRLRDSGRFFYGSVAYVLWLLLPLLLCVLLIVLRRRQIKENADVARSRNKKANKQAKKRLKTAEKYLDANDHEKFYDEILKALWGYFSDKFNIPFADLTKEKIEDELRARNVPENLSDDVRNVLSTCEFAHYSPTKNSGEMSQLYQKTIELIGGLEEIAKRK